MYACIYDVVIWLYLSCILSSFRRNDKDKIKFTAREHLNGMQPYNIILCYNVNIYILLEDIITILSHFSFSVGEWRFSGFSDESPALRQL